MATAPGVTSPAGAASGLVGYRYLLAVTLLVLLSSIPMLLVVAAGAAALNERPAAPPAEPSPFITYDPDRCSGGILSIGGRPRC